MLDFAPSPETRPRSMLSLDFSPYLLSASPPSSGFSLGSLSLTSNYSPYSLFSAPPNRPSSPCAKVHGTSYVGKTLPLKPIISMTSKDSLLSVDGPPSPPSEDPSESSSSSRRGSIKVTRHVSFADDVGRPLAEVRVMLDNPSAPPLLRGVPGHMNHDNEQDDDDDISLPVLIAPDPQPLMRDTFDEILCRNLLAVENVVVDNLELTCTVLINSHPCSKRVFGRYTVDSWQNFHDVHASFISLARPGYDRYKFVVAIPSSTDRSHSVQFAVCYEANGVQHWDNNDGQDFVVVWNTKAQDEGCPLDDHNTNAMDYGGLVWCSHEDLDHPYY